MKSLFSKATSNVEVVGVIGVNEVNQSMLQDENELRLRLKDLKTMNVSNNTLKANRAYRDSLAQLSEDRESLLY